MQIPPGGASQVGNRSSSAVNSGSPTLDLIGQQLSKSAVDSGDQTNEMPDLRCSPILRHRVKWNGLQWILRLR